MILTFASLSELFSQKALDDTSNPAPIVNSKFQETVFQKSFMASAEDIGNTSFDAALSLESSPGKCKKYLIGIKTFGFNSGFQKIAQFKALSNDLSPLLAEIRQEAVGKTEAEINSINAQRYLLIAQIIAKARNKRISSAKANIRGFIISEDDKNIESVYHVLMPSQKGEPNPFIKVGETDYSKIDESHISIIGCSQKASPANFKFTDGKHTYQFTAADSQLLMSFENDRIVVDSWDVKFADDPYSLFTLLSSVIFADPSRPLTVTENAIPSLGSTAAIEGAEVMMENQKGYQATTKPYSAITESYSWSILNNNGEVEPYSGYNSFFGVGSKLSTPSRKKRIDALCSEYEKFIPQDILYDIKSNLQQFLLSDDSNISKPQKEEIRNKIINKLNAISNQEYKKAVLRLIFRPTNELYIPVPNAKEFHTSHPNFFGPGIGTFIPGTSKLALEKQKRAFNLVFEPSGDSIRSFITQDNGKAIESDDKQSILGEWILRGVFQLKPFQQLTAKRLNEIGINGIRLYKTSESTDVHIEFIWIDNNSPPADYFHPSI